MRNRLAGRRVLHSTTMGNPSSPSTDAGAMGEVWSRRLDPDDLPFCAAERLPAQCPFCRYHRSLRSNVEVPIAIVSRRVEYDVPRFDVMLVNERLHVLGGGSERKLVDQESVWPVFAAHGLARPVRTLHYEHSILQSTTVKLVNGDVDVLLRIELREPISAIGLALDLDVRHCCL